MDQPKKIKIKALRLPENTLGTVNPQASKNAYKADFYGNNERDGVDFPALLQLINKVNTNPKCIFKWNDFERQPTIRTYDTRDGEGGTIQRMKITANNIPFTYKNEFGQTIETQLQAKLNKRIDFIDSQWSFKIDIDGKKNKIFAQLSLYYVNTEKFRKEVESTANPNDFNINDKYRAIIFQTENLTDFAHLVKEIDADSNYSYYIKDKITEKMVAALKATKDKEEIVFLFENAPSWIAENFKSEELITFLELILSYDVDGFWSGYVDGSSAFINVLRGFNTQEKCVDLYTFFKNNPTKLKEIYHALDGTSVWEGTQMANKTIFASFLVSLCYANYDQLEFASKTFFIGDGYKVNTSAIGALDFNKTKYFLKQERTKFITMIPLANFAYYPLTYDEDLEKGSEYNPLEMIIVYDYDQKQPPSKSKTAPIPMIVPAIFLHDMASREELAQIVKVVRIGVNIFVIALSVASFGSASPLVALMLAVDITLATTDTIIALAEDHLSQEFLETWSKIYLIGGAVTATPLLLGSAFKTGIKILDGTAKAEFKNFVRAFIFKVIIEKNIANFTKNTLRFVTENRELVSISKGLLNSNKLRQLNEYGAILVAGEVKNADKIYTEYALVYKGEVVIKGEKATFVKRVERFFEGVKSKGLKDFLEEFLGGNNYGESIVATSNPVKVQSFYEGLNRLQQLEFSRPFEKIQDVIAYFNHHLVYDPLIPKIPGLPFNKIEQIGKNNCPEIVECVVEFLRTGKVTKATNSSMKGWDEVRAKFGGGSFQSSTIIRIKELIKEDDIVIIYGLIDKSKPRIIGHYLVCMKKNGNLHFFDGQTAEYVFFSQTEKFTNFIRRGYKEFYYLNVR